MITNQNLFKKQEYIFAVTSNFFGVLSIKSINADSKKSIYLKCLCF